MKSSKFIIQDEPDTNFLLQLRNCEVSAENNVSISWEWPRDNSVKMVIVFQVETGEETLEKLLKNNSALTIITKSMEGRYNRPLECDKIRFKLFPASFGKDGEVIVFNQLTDNVTNLLFAKLQVFYSIQYKTIPFSMFQKVTIKIEMSDKYHLMPSVKIQDLLIYEKHVEDRHVLRYPIDDSAIYNGMTLYVRKSENIYIKPLDPYENILALYKEV